MVWELEYADFKLLDNSEERDQTTENLSCLLHTCRIHTHTHTHTHTLTHTLHN
jgi:quercetin dioxygenase-like cupin family protein